MTQPQATPASPFRLRTTEDFKQHREKLLKDFIERNVPKKYQNASLKNCTLIPREIVEFGEKWLKSAERPSLYLHGNTGSGKTFFSYSLLLDLYRENYLHIGDAKFIRSVDLDLDLANSFEDKSEKHKIKEFSNDKILFIDDMGVERTTDRSLRHYYAIIDHRTSNELPTIITSNSQKENLKTNDDRFLSRLEYFLCIEFPKRDLRKTFDIKI